MTQQSTQRRRDTRLQGWNYRLPGPYAITMCTQNRACRFGSVIEGQMVHNAIGVMIDEIWRAMSKEFPLVMFDTFVVMPNHVHAIMFMNAGDIERNPELGTIVQRFKSITTTRYITGVGVAGWEPFDGRLWQRNFYDHIIRDDRDLERCRTYIEANPGKWPEDQDNIS